MGKGRSLPLLLPLTQASSRQNAWLPFCGTQPGLPARSCPRDTQVGWGLLLQARDPRLGVRGGTAPTAPARRLEQQASL